MSDLQWERRTLLPGLQEKSWRRSAGKGVRAGEKSGCLPHSPFTLDGLEPGCRRALGRSGKRNCPPWFSRYWVVSILFHSTQAWGYTEVLDSGSVSPHRCWSKLPTSADVYIHRYTHRHTHTHTPCSLPLEPSQAAFQSFIQVNASESLCLLSHI